MKFQFVKMSLTMQREMSPRLSKPEFEPAQQDIRFSAHINFWLSIEIKSTMADWGC
jgi:hypothetical protein